MATPIITHKKVTSGTVNPAVEVDLHNWNDTHTVTGLENVQNVDTTNASNITSGTLPAAQMPALTGDVTTSVGTVATTLGNIPTGVTMAGTVVATNIAAPASPAAGKVNVWADSTDLRFHDKNAAGTIGTTVVADLGAANSFLTAINAAGVVSKTQPSIANISGWGTGVATALGVNVGSAGAPVLLNGAGGTPSSLTLTNATGLPIGTGLNNAGTGVLAALGVNIGTAGSFVVNGGALGSPSSAGTLPAFTLGGTISGGGNALNNIVIGGTTPLAGTFTTATANTSVSSPIHTASGKFSFQSNGSTFAGSVSTGQLWMFNSNDVAPASGVRATVSNNTAAIPALNLPATFSVAGADAARPVIGLQAFGAATAGPTMVFAGAGGTAASPTATAANDVLGLFVGYGYHTAGTPGYGQSGAGVGLQMVATEAYTATAAGGKLQFYTTPPTTVTITNAMTLNDSGGLSLGTTTDPGVGAFLANTSIKSQGATQGIGYATGAGGAVTQATSRVTGVTLNTVTGAITLVSAAGTATAQSFTVTNSAVAATDIPHVVQKSGTDLYEIFVTNVAAGSFKITFFTTGGTTTEQPIFNFAIIKGVTS